MCQELRLAYFKHLVTIDVAQPRKKIGMTANVCRTGSNRAIT
jgi:hypothetical protein